MKRWMLALGLLVLSLLFARGAVAEEEIDLNKLRRLARKLEAPITSRDGRVEKQSLNEFIALTPNEALELRRIHREIYWTKHIRKTSRKRVFSAMEKIDEILFQLIEEKFGPEATPYTLSDEQISWLMNEVMGLEEIRQLAVGLENGLSDGKGCKRCSSNQNQEKIGALGTCDYQNFPILVPYEHKYTGYYKAYKVDRVKNGPEDWFCDYRMYIEPRNYRSVDGRSFNAMCAVSKHGGMGATNNKDRFIIGFGSIWLCHVLPYESYLKEAIIFRE